MSLYDRLRTLELRVDDLELARRSRDTSGGFERVTTVVSLTGDGETGRGEDVTYEAAEHDALLDADLPSLAGEYTFDAFSDALDDVDLFPAGAPDRESFRHYRRWAFESAALDLALRQADTNLAAALDREYDPVEFVVSTRLEAGEGGAPTADRVHAWLDVDPDLEFKLDPTPAWTPDLLSELAATGAVRIADLKGYYEGTAVDAPPDPDRYRRVLEAFPAAVVEDPAVTEETRPVLEAVRDRLSWDAPITDVASVEARPWPPRWINVKPSRFGTLESLLATVEHCADAGIRMYGGGQYELDVGRQHLHALASLFYSDGPNDVAPSGYNDPEPRAGLPGSPLSPPADPRGLSWSSGD